MILLRNAHGLGIPNFLTHSTAVDTCSTLGIQNMTSCWMVHFPRYGVKIWIPSFFYHIKIGKGDDFYCGRSTKMLGKPMALPRKIGSFGSPAGRGVVPPFAIGLRRVTKGCQKMAENFHLWSWWMSEPIGKMNENDIWTYMILYYDPIWTIISWAKLVWNPILAFRVLLGVYPHLPRFRDKKDSRHGVLT